MYNSKYYNCEQIDQRLLQGYVDDYNQYNGTSLNKSEYLDLLSRWIKGTAETAIYQAIEALQVGGIALAGGFGESEVLGIHQKALTSLFTSLYDQLNNKQGSINDLDSIREGASKGYNSYIKPEGGIPVTDLAAAIQIALQSIPEAQVQSDWGQDDSTAPDFIKDKPEVYTKNEIDTKVDDINRDISTLTNRLVNEFGTNIDKSINQKKLTDTFNDIYILLEEALNKPLLGFTWKITPDHLTKSPNQVIIEVLPTNPNTVLESVYLTINGNKVEGSDRENVESAYYDIIANDTTDIRVDVTVLNVPYHREHRLIRYKEVWIGAGNVYTDVFDGTLDHAIDISNGMRLTKDINVSQGDNIFIILDTGLYEDFIRADINGVEILFSEDTDTLSGYIILTSNNTYSEGKYNIDING